MLSDQEALWLLNVAKRYRSTLAAGELRDDISAHIKRIEAELEQPVEPLELLIHCPRCLRQHVDEGRFAQQPHSKHACQFCGLGFVASKEPSIGVQFFSGWRTEEAAPLGYDTSKTYRVE